MSDTNPLIQNVQRTTSRTNAKKTIFRHIIFKLWESKNKEKYPERSQMKKTPYLQRNNDKNYIGLLRNHKDNREWSEIFCVERK